MSVQTEITRLSSAKTALKSAIEAKGVTVGSGTLDTFAAKVALIEVPDINVYVGTSEPSSSLGKDGDIYLKI